MGASCFKLFHSKNFNETKISREYPDGQLFDVLILKSPSKALSVAKIIAADRGYPLVVVNPDGSEKTYLPDIGYTALSVLVGKIRDTGSNTNLEFSQDEWELCRNFLERDERGYTFMGYGCFCIK